MGQTWRVVEISTVLQHSLLKPGIIASHNNYVKYSFIFIPLACAACDDSLPFPGASSIHLFCIPFSSTLLHQLVLLPTSLHLAIYILVYISASLFPNSYMIPFWKFVIYLTLFSLLQWVFNHCMKFFIGWYSPIHFFIVINWAKNSSIHFPFKNVSLLSISLLVSRFLMHMLKFCLLYGSMM